MASFRAFVAVLLVIAAVSSAVLAETALQTVQKNSTANHGEGRQVVATNTFNRCEYNVITHLMTLRLTFDHFFCRVAMGRLGWLGMGLGLGLGHRSLRTGDREGFDSARRVRNLGVLPWFRQKGRRLRSDHHPRVPTADLLSSPVGSFRIDRRSLVSVPSYQAGGGLHRRPALLDGHDHGLCVQLPRRSLAGLPQTVRL